MRKSKEEFEDMVDQYIDRELLRIEYLSRSVLDYFAMYLDSARGEGFKIGDLTESDLYGYCNYFKECKDNNIKLSIAVSVLTDFIGFAKDQGWVDKITWSALYRIEENCNGNK